MRLPFGRKVTDASDMFLEQDHYFLLREITTSAEEMQSALSMVWCGLPAILDHLDTPA